MLLRCAMPALLCACQVLLTAVQPFAVRSAPAPLPQSKLDAGAPPLKATLLVYGLGAAGKTVLVKNYVDTPLDGFWSAPTLGFEREQAVAPRAGRDTET